MNRKAAIIFLACIMLFFSSANALSFSANKTKLFKGESIIIMGNALSRLSIAGYEGKNFIFSERPSLDWNGDFRFEYSIDFLDPKGIWTITLTDGNSTEKFPITVEPTRESEFLVVAFLSPAPISFRRLDSFDLSVKVSDAGKPVRDARLSYWDANGSKHSMKSLGDGTYSDRIKIPIDSNIGSWELTVTAYNDIAREKRGGENSVKLRIEQAAISIDVLEPRVSEYVIGKPIELRIRAHYDANADFQDASEATIAYGIEKIKLKSEGLGVFSASIDPLAKSQEAKPVELTIRIADKYGNFATKTASFRPIGELYWLLQNNAIFYIIPGLFVVYVLFLALRELSSHFAVSRLRRKKAMLLELKKRLQQDYFVDNMVSRQDYENQEEQFDSEINNVDAKLKALEQKKELL